MVIGDLNGLPFMLWKSFDMGLSGLNIMCSIICWPITIWSLIYVTANSLQCFLNLYVYERKLWLCLLRQNTSWKWLLNSVFCTCYKPEIVLYDHQQNFRFATCTKHIILQRNNRQILASLNKLWMYLIFFKLYFILQCSKKFQYKVQLKDYTMYP